MNSHHTFNPGDEVYNLHGQKGLYVSRAKGGGHIVQLLVEQGDGFSEPAGEYVDGVDIWQEVYSQAPQPVLDEKIAAQEKRLAELRAEIAAASQQRSAMEAEQRAMKDRLAMFEELRWIDDLLAGNFQFFLVRESDHDKNWLIKTAEEFRQSRSGSQLRLRLWVSLNERGPSLAWRYTQGSPSDRWDDKSRSFIPAKTLEEARALQVKFAMEDLEDHLRNSYNASADGLRPILARITHAGAEPPQSAVDELRRREQAEAAAALQKASDALELARKRFELAQGAQA